MEFPVSWWKKLGAGVYVEPENPQDFAEKIKIYMAYPDRLKREGENGFIYARRNFNRTVLGNK